MLLPEPVLPEPVWLPVDPLGLAGFVGLVGVPVVVPPVVLVPPVGVVVLPEPV